MANIQMAQLVKFSFLIKPILGLGFILLSLISFASSVDQHESVGQVSSKDRTKVLVIGASGSLARFVIDTLQKRNDVHLTLLARDKSKINNKTSGCTIVEADVFDYPRLKAALTGQDVVYINLAGDLEAMTKNIVRGMKETGVKRVIAISSIGIYETLLKPVLVPYRKLADVLEGSGLTYTILRPNWFTNGNEINYVLTKKGQPETGTAISRRSIAAFIASLVTNPGEHLNENLGISKPK